MSPPNEAQLNGKVNSVLGQEEASQTPAAAQNGKHTRSPIAEVAIDFPGQLMVAIDEYVGPLGIGWQARFGYSVDGGYYRRVVNNGPETWRSKGWSESNQPMAQG